VKKLAMVVLLVAAACGRQAVVTSAPATPASGAAASNLPGGASARDALNKFLAAVKVQDVQALSNIWGTKDGGAAATDRRYMTVEVMEQRLIIMIRCARHDSWTVKSETPLAGGDRQFTVELKLRNSVATTDFVAVPGPGGRWFIKEYGIEQTMPICQAQ
jgi:hypothetical protein